MRSLHCNLSLARSDKINVILANICDNLDCCNIEKSLIFNQQISRNGVMFDFPMDL